MKVIDVENNLDALKSVIDGLMHVIEIEVSRRADLEFRFEALRGATEVLHERVSILEHYNESVEKRLDHLENHLEYSKYCGMCRFVK
jgi:hypothetical protein